jgi:ABC-type sugar transport system permease subunit
MATSASVARRSSRATTLARREAITAYLFIAPYLITAGIFTFGVLMYVFYTSFTNLSASFAAASARFVGLDNYIRALRDSEFRIALANVFWYFVLVTTLQTIGAILLATLLNVKLKGMRIYRTMLYAPCAPASSTISWEPTSPGCKIHGHYSLRSMGCSAFKPTTCRISSAGQASPGLRSC